MKITYTMSSSNILIFMCNKTKFRGKKHFCKHCLPCFSSKKVLIKHEEACFNVNGTLRSGSIQFQNHFEQLAVSFKINAYFECNVKRIRSSDRADNSLYTEKYQAHIPCSFVYNVVCVDNKFSKSVAFYREKKWKNAVYRFIETILKEYDYFRGVMKKHFNKNVVMSEKDEQIFRSSNNFWICNKLFDVGDNKVRDYSHITGKYGGSVHWNCNINLRLDKRVPVIFHNLRSYGSHFIIREIKKRDVKVNVIRNLRNLRNVIRKLHGFCN